ncbi:homoserine O-acetyltransferase MetX [Actinospica sp.]|uniref:homoserine O-acetyltransferase MetX n=1 Tax=Actinospica sp. TaxID=1872142 RepID=UPI002CF899A0|nr:homoserine O-acetyltransferase [Actinospica sp.]HWG26977.1 homoserine O-acetyltransferase [Actinospica sp.]
MPATEPVAPPPASGAWREGEDDPGRRDFLRADRPLELEVGGRLPGVTVAYETWGTLNPRRDNAVLVLHALTGDSHVAGRPGPGHPTPGWWNALIGPGRALDTDEWFVVAPNVLGGCQGTTGPSSTAPDGRPWGSRFPRITIRDQVEAEVLLADALGIGRWASVFGGSMGGMRALEWAVTYPDRVGSLLLLAVGAYATADQIGLQSTQIHAVRADGRFNGGDYYAADPGGGPHLGLGIARRIAHLSYRSENELARRFGRLSQEGEDPPRSGRYAVESYLDHHAAKLARRFDANSYVVLTEAMNHHDVGRGRDGVAEALKRITAPTVVGGIDSDRLYPPYLQEELARLIPGADGPHLVRSPYGHDAFLIEADEVAALMRRTLGVSTSTGATVSRGRGL